MGIHLKVLIFYYLVVGNSEFLIADGNSSFILNGKGMESTCEYFCNPAFEISSYVPPTFTENFPPRILSQNYTVPPGKSYVVLKWTEPIATDQHGKKARIEQVAGVKNGGKFNGSVNGQRHQIVYIATDKNGLKNSSSFVKYVSIPKCPELDVVKNGQYRCTDGRAPDSSCMFTCNKGYLLNEIENITCEHTALQPSWSGSRRCEKINCREPAVPENAKISCANGGYGYQSVCLVQCNQGYTPSGPLYMICKSDGYWSKETHCLRNTVLEFQCSPVQCNGHTCKQTPEQEIQCNCSNGWSGQRCEQPPDYCRNNICMNNGKCNNRYLAYNCTCPNTYSGVLCQISPVDGNWSDWTSWSSCSRTCGSGNQTRFRLCDSPPPSPSGEFCPGKETDSKPCKISNCNVCPPLKQYNDSRSTYDCEVYNNYGQERCQIVCEEGTMLLPQFKQFSEIICGWSTNYIWIPANIQPSCVVSVPPKGFLLETKILYNEVIPVELENTFKVEVLTNLKPTDCFRPSMIKCETSVRNRIGSVQSQMDITFKIVLESDDSSSVKEARHILERTADYIKDYISEIFDISLGQTVFKSDKKSFSISTSSECEKGSVPYDGMCVLCPVGTSASNGRCEICEKGFYQNKKEQTKCEPCPAGKTTIQPGAIQPFECFEPKENSFEKAMDVVKVVVSVVSSIVTVIGAVATFLTVKKICCKKCKKNGEGVNAEAQDETNLPERRTMNTQSDARHQDQELQLLNSSDWVNTVDPDNHIESN